MIMMFVESFHDKKKLFCRKQALRKRKLNIFINIPANIV